MNLLNIDQFKTFKLHNNPSIKSEFLFDPVGGPEEDINVVAHFGKHAILRLQTLQDLIGQVLHVPHHHGHHVLLVLVLELLAKTQQPKHDIADNNRQFQVALLQVQCHHLKEVRGDNLLEGQLFLGQRDDVVEDMGDLLADVEGGFIVQQLH